MLKSVFHAIAILIGISSCVAHAQTLPSNPYRNFIGDWSGVIEINHEDMPSTLTVHITEEVKKHRMRWDYVFGKPGDKGYCKNTKWVEFKPLKEEMSTKWKGEPEEHFKTTKLNEFADLGFGVLVATRRGEQQRCIYELRPATFDYLWQTWDGNKITIYSKFHFTRVGLDSHAQNVPAQDPKQK